jgi:RNA polymerase sigma-54 factor
VLVNQTYYSKVSKGREERGQGLLSRCLQTANWLTRRALDQRARTILKVATEIVRQQDGFFASWRRSI